MGIADVIRHLIAVLLLAVAASFAWAQGYKPTGAAPADDVYVFGIHPYTNPQDLFDAYEPIVQYLQKKLPGSRFQIEASRDYADYEAKLAARRFHFSLPNPAQTLVSLDYGYRVVAKMTPDEDFRGLIIARADRAPASVRDLAGKPLCFPSPSAVAGTMLPLMYLQEHGLPAKSLNIKYVGSQFSSIVNAHSGEFAACGSTSRFWRTWARDNPQKAKEMTVLWRTPSLPHNAVVARDDLPEGFAGRVAAVLAGMDKDPDLDQSRFRVDQQHFELADNASYRPMLDFLRRYEEAIGLPAPIRLPRKAAIEAR